MLRKVNLSIKITILMAFVILLLNYPNITLLSVPPGGPDLTFEGYKPLKTCNNTEYESSVVNEVDLTTDLKDTEISNEESLKSFCNPYDYTKVEFQGKEYHFCLWQLQDDSIVSFALHSGRIWELHNLIWMYNLTHGLPRGIVIDAGANVGLFTVVAASLGHTVFSFEPISDHVQMIKKSLALNGLSSYVRLFRNGLGNFNQKSTIHLKLGNKGGSAVDLKTDSEHKEEVNLIRLDELFESLSAEYPLQKLIFWKADIEGWEERMFNGAQLWYTHYKPNNLLIELNAGGVKQFQCNFGDFLNDLLDHYEFHLFYTDGNKPGPRIDKENVYDFATGFPSKIGHVYDVFLSAKHIKK